MSGIYFLQYIRYTALFIVPNHKFISYDCIRIWFRTFWQWFYNKIELKILKYTTKASQKCHSDSYQTQSLNCSTDLYIQFYEISLPFSSIMDPNVLNYASFRFIRLPPYHRNLYTTHKTYNKVIFNIKNHKLITRYQTFSIWKKWRNLYNFYNVLQCFRTYCTLMWLIELLIVDLESHSNI